MILTQNQRPLQMKVSDISDTDNESQCRKAMKRVYEITLIDHMHWSHVNLWQKITNNQILVHLQIKSPREDVYSTALLNSILLVCEELSRIMNNHATSALHMHSSVSFTVQMRPLKHKNYHLQWKQTFQRLSCRNNELVYNKSDGWWTLTDATEALRQSSS